MPVKSGLARRAGQAEVWAARTGCTSVGTGCIYLLAFCVIYGSSVNSPVQVFPSLETTLPAGQVAAQFPLSRTKPGKHWSHCRWSWVAALGLKLGIEHLAHFGGQVSHTFLRLSTTSEVPWHSPVLSKTKHCPPRRAAFGGQEVQSDELGPVHDAQRELQTRQEVPDWKVPAPQVADPAGMHLVGMVGC